MTHSGNISNPYHQSERMYVRIPTHEEISTRALPKILRTAAASTRCCCDNFFPAANANKCRRNPLDDKKKELALKETLYEVALEKLDRQGVEREWKQETMEIEKEMFEHKRRNQSFKHWKQSNEHATDVPKMSGAWREWESKEKKLSCLQTNKRRKRIETSKWFKKGSTFRKDVLKTIERRYVPRWLWAMEERPTRNEHNTTEPGRANKCRYKKPYQTFSLRAFPKQGTLMKTQTQTGS